MNLANPFIKDFSQYIPEAVRDAAGLNSKIDDSARHILSVDVACIPLGPSFGSDGNPHATSTGPPALRSVLCLGYTDGFQVYDLDEMDQGNIPREVLSRQDKEVVLLKMLPTPMFDSGDSSSTKVPLGVAAAPLLCYAQAQAQALVRIYSLTRDEVVYVLRCTQNVTALQASARVLAVGQAAGVVDLYDAATFSRLFSVGVFSSPEAVNPFALGHRWLAYNALADAPGSPNTVLNTQNQVKR